MNRTNRYRNLTSWFTCAAMALFSFGWAIPGAFAAETPAGNAKPPAAAGSGASGIAPVPGTSPTSITPPAETPDFPEAIWTPASSEDFQMEKRPVEEDINMVVIHDIEGTAESAIHIFQDPKSQVTAHYVLDSTGHIYQMVKEHDVAWHAGNRMVNHHSIGIEHEGFAYQPGYFNTLEYEASARLVRSITRRYNIPRDRTHIIGHAEVPNPTKPGLFGGASGHTDPGPYWDWESYMILVRNDAHIADTHLPVVIHPGEKIPATVSFQNAGDDPWPNSFKSSQASPAVTKGAVYLGVWNPTGTVSELFDPKTWPTPRTAASARDGDTLPGAVGQFEFSITGPRTLGAYNEQFRLTKYPPAPGRATSFGDVVNVGLIVQPWEIVQPASGVNFSAAGWDARDGVVSRKTTGPAEPMLPAAWTVTLPISGTWEVYARWTADKDNTAAATYQITDADGLHPVTINQRTGGEWVSLGRYHYSKSGPATVVLSSDGPPGTVVADSVKFVGPF